MRIEKEKTIGLVVDIQEKLVPHIYESEKLVKNVELLIKGLQALEIPIMVTEQYKKGLGETIAPLEALIAQQPHVEKMAFSCCDEPNFMEKLELSTKQFVILAGIESHICLLQTAIDLKEMGFQPVVVEDCVSSRTLENKQMGIERMKQEGVIVTGCESVLFELCRYAGTDAFKTISKLVK